MSISRFLPLLFVFTCLLALPAQASARDYLVDCRAIAGDNPLCVAGGSYIGTVKTNATLAGQSMAVSVDWSYTSRNAFRAWNVGRVRATCITTRPGLTPTLYRTVTRKIYKNLAGYGAYNNSYWRGALSIKVTCPIYYNARRYTFNGTVNRSLNDGSFSTSVLAKTVY